MAQQRCYLSAAIIFIIALLIGLAFYEYVYAPYGLKCNFMSMKNGNPVMWVALALTVTIGALLFAVSRASTTFEGYAYSMGFTSVLLLCGFLAIMAVMTGNVCAFATTAALYSLFWIFVVGSAGALATYASYNWIIIKQ